MTYFLTTSYDLTMSAADDRRGGEPRGGAEGGLLPRALVAGGRQPLHLLQGGDRSPHPTPPPTTVAAIP